LIFKTLCNRHSNLFKQAKEEFLMLNFIFAKYSKRVAEAELPNLAIDFTAQQATGSHVSFLQFYLTGVAKV
jgi:hypothetical protein